jgi:amidase
MVGRTRNPWDQAERGGSTGGGAAALASGMIALAKGQTLVVRFASRRHLRVVGLRPSVGLVPSTDWSGTRCNHADGAHGEDVALIAQSGGGPAHFLNQPAGRRDFVAENRRVPGLRIATARTLWHRRRPDVERVCRAAAFA